MDTKLLLKEKDYELLETKRIIPFKHAFNDPLINPPKRKAKPTKALKAAPQPKEIGLPANNILSRLSKPVKQSLLLDQKTAVE